MKKMQNVGQSDTQKLDKKVNVNVPSSTANSRNSNNMSTPSNTLSSSNNSTPTKSDTETFTDFQFQPRVTDSSESDEESVSEVIIFP